MTIKATDLSTSSLPRLATDLTYPEDKFDGGTYYRVIIDPSLGLTTAINLSGKFAVTFIRLSTLSANDLSTVKLTVDGTIRWNTPITTNLGTEILLGFYNTNSTDIAVLCNSSFLLELQTATDTTVTVDFIARPIL